MSTITLTIIIAFFLVILALAALGISWLLTGKSTLRPGACGRDPTKKRDDETCGTETTCTLCKEEKPEEKRKKK